MVTRRGRGKTVCARGAHGALLGGPSTSPLVAMAQLIGILGAIVFLAAVNFYARYVFRRFGVFSGSPPEFVGPAPRGKRLALFWLAIAFTVVVLMPAAVVAIAYPLRMFDCGDKYLPSEPPQCSPGARLSFALGLIVIGLPLMAMWMRFLLGRIMHNAGHGD